MRRLVPFVAASLLTIATLTACSGPSAQEVACPLSENEVSAIVGQPVDTVEAGDYVDSGDYEGVANPYCIYDLEWEYGEVAVNRIFIDSIDATEGAAQKERFFTLERVDPERVPRPEWGELAWVVNGGARFEASGRFWGLGILMSNSTSGDPAPDLSEMTEALVDAVRNPN